MPNIVVKGKGKQTLAKTEFVASGGEGAIYAKNGVAYKIYTDSQKMIPEGKINELQALTEPNIIKPLDIILDSRNNPIGYTMRFVTDTYAMCQLFNKAFKQRNNLSLQQIFDLVQKMQKGVQHVHDKGILIVDCNELNFLVAQNFNDVYFIDVDSYQTPSYRATALMESVRDRQVKNNKFTKDSDWFSWGIVTFQLFIGIHPYKGKHPTLRTMDERMLKNISVFNKDVDIPKACEPFDTIPQAYRDWYKAVFEDGKRLCPPTDAVATVTVTIKTDVIVGSHKFEFKEITDLNDLGEITNVVFSFGTRLVQGKKGILIYGKVDPLPPTTKISFTPQMNHAIAAQVDKGSIKLTNLSTGKSMGEVGGVRVMAYENRFYVKDGDSVYEIEYIELPIQTRPTMRLVANIVDKATTFYDGVLVQKLLEATFVSLFPQPGMHYEIRVKELEGLRVVDAKFDRQVLQVVAVTSSGKYQRLVFRFSSDFSEYDVRVVPDITHTGLNFVVLDTGTCVQIDEEERVNVFRNIKDDPRLTVIDDPAIQSDMRLYRWAGQAVVAKGDKLYSLKMKP